MNNVLNLRLEMCEVVLKLQSAACIRLLHAGGNSLLLWSLGGAETVGFCAEYVSPT